MLTPGFLFSCRVFFYFNTLVPSKISYTLFIFVSDDESDDDDEDDTEALMAELDQIKKERVEERLRKVILLLSAMFLLRLLLKMDRIGFLKHNDITKISLVRVKMY